MEDRVGRAHLDLGGIGERPCSRRGRSQPGSVRNTWWVYQAVRSLGGFRKGDLPVTWTVGGRKDVQTRWTFLVLTWMLRLQQCTWTGLKALSLGQMSLSPANGAIVMVFLCSTRGRLLLRAPSRNS